MTAEEHNKTLSTLYFIYGAIHGLTLLGLLGLVLIFKFASVAGELISSMWMTVGTFTFVVLLLAVGLLLGRLIPIRVAALWMIPGLVVWFLYVVMPYGVFLTSMLAHIGALIAAMIALQRVRVDARAWMYALGWYFIVQLLSRWLTPVEFNVNLSQTVQAGWEQTFSSYWKFWVVLTLLVAAGLWALGKVFSLLWPAPLPDLRASIG